MNTQLELAAQNMNEIWKQWEGQVVNGKFPLQKYLGGSGHGIVFLTERPAPASGRAAIKLCLENPAQAEARLAGWAKTAGLSHPNLLQVYEAGRCRLGDTALLYVVMEHADEDLSQVLAQRALEPAEAQELLPPVVKALAYLHCQGLVHGHVKPTNVMAIADLVKLSSDGLCAVAAGATESWSSYPGMEIYDPIHDPPEAESGALTPAADIWSLGVTLVEALTLRRVIWDRTGRGGTKDPELILPEGISGPFLDVVRNSLILAPRQRWSADEIVARLEGKLVAPHKPEPKRSASPGAGGKRGSKKGLFAALVVIGLLSVWFLVAKMRHSGSAPGQMQIQVEQLPPEPKPAPAPVAQAMPVPSAPAPIASAKPRNSGGHVSGAVVQQVMPEVSKSARGSIEGHVRVSVKVFVDASGNVSRAGLESAGPSSYFARQALKSAQGWKFTPPQKNGEPVPSEWLLKYAFSKSGTDVHPSQVAP